MPRKDRHEGTKRVEVESGDILEVFKLLLMDQQHLADAIAEQPLPPIRMKSIYHNPEAGPMPGRPVPGSPNERIVPGQGPMKPAQVRTSCDTVMYLFGMILESVRKDAQSRVQNRLQDGALRMLTRDSVFDRIWKSGRDRFLPGGDQGESEVVGVNVTGWMDSWMGVRYDIFDELVGAQGKEPIVACAVVDAAFMLYYRKLEAMAKMPAAVIETIFEGLREQFIEMADRRRPSDWPKEYGT